MTLTAEQRETLAIVAGIGEMDARHVADLLVPQPRYCTGVGVMLSVMARAGLLTRHRQPITSSRRPRQTDTYSITEAGEMELRCR